MGVTQGSSAEARRLLRVGIAARVSTKDRDLYPETQLRRLREHVASLEGAELVGEFVDKASVEDLRGRQEWRRLLELARRRQVDLILVWRIDRAFRSVLDGAQTLANLRSWRCGLRSLQEPWIDTTTPMGEALFHITVVWAQLERQTISDRRSKTYGSGWTRDRARELGRPTTEIVLDRGDRDAAEAVRRRGRMQTESLNTNGEERTC